MMFAASFRSLWRGRPARAAWLAIVVAVFAAPAAAATPSGGARVALVIGNSAYASVGRLANPGNDAKLIARSLKAAGFTLVGGDALLDLGKPRFDAAVEQFGRAIAGAEVALFYYSGHGLQVDGTNWLVPVDANPSRPQDLDFQMVNADLVLRQMSGSGTKLNILILDACRNNPFGGRGLRATGGGLAEMKAPEGTLISYATQPGAVASDGDGRDSPFTLALVDAMRQPGLDIFRMFNRVGLSVKKTTAGQQQPWLSASPIEGEFAFSAPGPTPTPVPTPTPAEQTVALAPPLGPAAPVRQGAPLEPTAPAGAGFRCPEKDTVVSGEAETFDWSGPAVSVRGATSTWAWRSLGGDAAQPALCLHESTRGTQHRLVGWYNTDDFAFPDDPAAPMLALLQQRTDSMQVRSVRAHPVGNGVVSVWTSTWTRRGQEALAIAGRSYGALVFDVTESSNRNSFTGAGRVWYAPALQLFVRAIWRSATSSDVVGWTVTGVGVSAAQGAAPPSESAPP